MNRPMNYISVMVTSLSGTGKCNPLKKSMVMIHHLRKNLRNGLPNDLRVGKNVSRGDHIAYVGQLRTKDKNGNWKNGSTMLHFEMYKGNVTSYLTHIGNKQYDNVASGQYSRRKELMDPASFLDDTIEA